MIRSDIEKLINSDSSYIQVFSSSEPVQLLLKNDLVDKRWLKIHSVSSWQRKKLFDNGAILTFTFIESMVAPDGATIVNYK